ncbi:MAG: hypothetical protein IKM43_01570 [Clostridia bacterium]|nr:hypothetical protein [Clostridia bacterium]
MQETEITVEVFEEKEELFNKLKGNNFEIVGHYLLTDYYFSKYNTKKLKNMTYAEIIKNSFLVRQFNDDCSIVYKNKKFDKYNNVISESKKIFKIEDSAIANDVFLKAGLNNWCKLTQDMYHFKKEEIEIFVQIIQGLGIFIEFEEYASIAHLQAKQKFDIMIKTLKSIGLNIGDDFSVKKPYKKLMR